MKATKINPLKKGFSILAVALCCLTAFSQRTKDAKILFHRGLHLEEVKGELDEAIAVFRQVVERFPDERMVTAQALLHLGICYQKLGKKEAQKAYRRIIQEFSDQKEAVTEARARLTALEKLPGSAAETMTMRRIWSDWEQTDTEGSVSPDGQYLTFVDWETGDLALHDLATGENRRLTNKRPWSVSADFALGSRISPEGKKIAYAWIHGGTCDLRLISLDSPESRILYSNEDVEVIFPGGWSPDGRHISACLQKENKALHQIVLISVADGSVRVLKTVDWRQPNLGYFSPDGRYIVYDFPPEEDSPQRDIFLMPADGNREVQLVKHPANDYVLGWAPDGERFLFSSDRTGKNGIWIIKVTDGSPQGDPILIKPDVGLIRPLGFTKDASFYYGYSGGLSDVYLAKLDQQTGKVLAAPARISQHLIGNNRSPAYSPDGKNLAYISHQYFYPFFYTPQLQSIVIRSLVTFEDHKLSPEFTIEPEYSSLRWSPDGGSILVRGRHKNGKGLFQIDVQTGDANLLVLSGPKEMFRWPAWSPDGKVLYYLRIDLTDRSSSIMAHDVETGKTKELYSAIPPSILSNFALSPDGLKIVFRNGDRKTYTLLDVLKVMPAAGGEPHDLMRERIPEGQSIFDRVGLEWARDGKHILFGRWHNYSDSTLELWRVSAQGGEPESLGVVMKAIADLSIHPDGRQIAFTAGLNIEEIWALENFLPKEK